MDAKSLLPPIFAENNICELDAYRFETKHIPARKVGNAWRSTHLSAMNSHELSLRLDGAVYCFEEARNLVRYITANYGGAPLTPCAPPRVVTIQRIVTLRGLTLLLIDEKLGKPLAVIGERLSWHEDGLDVRLATPDGTTLHEL